DVLLIDTGRSLEFIKGNGDGTFQTPQFVPSVVADKFVTDDFNSDGKLDLVVTSSSANTTSICLGNGDGTFQSPITLFSGRQSLRETSMATGNSISTATLSLRQVFTWAMGTGPLDPRSHLW